MSTAETKLGRIEVSRAAIASIAIQATANTYGVVGITRKNLASQLTRFLQGDTRHGVDVRIENGQVFIDVHVIVEYGTRIVSAARSVVNLVEFNLGRSLGVPLAQINVHVEGPRVSNPD